MDFDLSEQHELVRATVRDFAESEIAPRAAEMDREARFPYEIVSELGKLGLMGVPFPEEYGGSGGDTLAYALTIEELSRVDSSVAITVAAHTSLGTNPIYLFGTEEQKQEWMPQLTSGRVLGAFALTEPDTGSDAGAIRTSARLQNGHWVINGTKAFITNSGTDITALVNLAVVTDKGAGGHQEISNLIVPQNTPGHTRGPDYRKLGWHAADTHELHFEDAQVPAKNLLGVRGKGLAQFLSILDAGRISVAAMGLGLAQAVYEMALRYAGERSAFGHTIGTYQAVSFALVDMATSIEGARLLLYKAAILKDRGRPYETVAAMAKLTCTELALQAADQAVQIHGAYGCMEEFPVSRFFRDARILTIGEGTSEIMRLVISRAIGAGRPRT